MSTASEKTANPVEAIPPCASAIAPKCLAISEHGISNADEFAQFMSAVMGDVIAGRLSAAKAGAATRSGSTLLKVIEMKYKYGSETEQPGKRTLRLID